MTNTTATPATFTVGTIASGTPITPQAPGTDSTDIQVSVSSGGSVRMDEIEDIVLNFGSGGDMVNVTTPLGGTALNINTITVNGGVGNDTVDASGITSGHRVVFNGGDGNDTFTSGGGDDIFNGGEGSDTASYAAGLTATDITDNGAGGWTVATGGAEGADTLSNVEIVDGAGAGRFLLVGNGGFASLQDAVEAANAGDTILVGNGAFDVTKAGAADPAQLVIDKDLTIIGQGMGTSTIQAAAATGTSGDARGMFLVSTGVTLNVSNLSVSGNGHNVYQGFRHNGSVTFDKVTFTDIQYKASGPHYQGTAIAVFGGGAGQTVDVTDSVFTDIGRVGVLYFGSDVAGTFEGNSYTGKGAGDHLDYALDISAGAGVIVRDNQISDNLGVASSDGSISAGILVTTFFGAGTEATIGGNTFTDNTTGVVIGYNNADTSTVSFEAGNSFTGGSDGVIVVGDAVVNDIDLIGGPNGTVDWDGGANVNLIDGADLGDTLNGGAGSDSITGRGGDDQIDGGADTDTAIYADALTASNIASNGAGGWTVTTATEGTDTLTNVEFVDGAGAGRFLLVGNGGFATIQAAVDAANAGDTIMIAEGSYAENVTVSTANLTIIGANANIAGDSVRGAESALTGMLRFAPGADGSSVNGLQILEGGSALGSTAGVYVQADNIDVSNMLIERSGGFGVARGIVTASGDAQGLEVTASKITGFATGIYINPGSDATITGNVLEANNVGLSNDGPDASDISGNSFVNNVVEQIGIGAANVGVNDVGAIVGANSFTGSAPEVSIYDANGAGQAITGTEHDDIIHLGAGNDTIDAGDGDDTVIWTVGDGRNIVDGGVVTNTDTFEAVGTGAAGEEFLIETAAAYNARISPAPSDLAAGIEIVVSRSTDSGASFTVIAELSNIDDIVINGISASPSASGFGVTISGDFSGTDLDSSTITILGTQGDDAIDVSNFIDSNAGYGQQHIIFVPNGGDDTITGARPEDLVDLTGRTVTGNEDLGGASDRLTFDDGSTFTFSNGTPSFVENAGEAGQLPVNLPAPESPLVREVGFWDEFIVSQSTAGFQYDQSLVQMADGRVVAIFTTHDSAFHNAAGGITVASRVGSVGLDGSVTWGDEFRVNEHTQNNGTTNGAQHFEGSVIEIEPGKLLYLYRGGSGHTADTDDGAAVLARIATIDGAGTVTFGSEDLVNGNTGGFQSGPDIVLLSDGRVAFTYVTPDSPGTDNGAAIALRIASIDGGGNLTFGTETQVNQYGSNNQLDPKIAELPDGRLVVAFTTAAANTGDAGGTNDYGVGVRVAQVAASGALSFGSEQLVNVETSGHQRISELLVLNDGRVVFVYSAPDLPSSGDTSVTARVGTVAASGSISFGAETVFAVQETGDRRVNHVLELPDGRLLFAYTDVDASGADSSGSALLGRLATVDNSGSFSFEDPFVINQATGGNQEWPEILQLDDGRLLISFRSYDATVDSDQAHVAGRVLDLGLGGEQADTIHGLDSNDFLSGFGGDDLLFGGLSDDILNGGLGFDTLTGGDGGDTFVFDADALSDAVNNGIQDLIADYDILEGDVVDLSALLGGQGVNDGNETSFVRVDGTGKFLEVDIDGTGTAHDFVQIAEFSSAPGAESLKILVDDSTDTTVTI